MKRNRIVFFIISTLFWVSLYTYMPSFPVYCISLGASMEFMAVIAGSYGLMQFLFRIPIGLLMDKTGKALPFVLAGITFGLISAAGFFLAVTPEMLLLFRAAAGLSASFFVTMTAVYAGFFEPEEVSKAMGIINASFFLGMALATLSGSWVAEQFGGYKAPFALSAVASAIAILLCFLLKGMKDIQPGHKRVQIKELFKIGLKKTIIVVSLCGAVSWYVVFAFLTFNPVKAKALGAGNIELGILTGCYLIPSIASSLLVATNKNGPDSKKTWLVSSLILLGLNSLVAAFAQSLAVLYVSQAVLGLCIGIQSTYFMNFAVLGAPLQMRATAISFYQAIYSLGMFLGPVITGATSAAGLINGYFVMAALGLMGAALIAFAISPKKDFAPVRQ